MEKSHNSSRQTLLALVFFRGRKKKSGHLQVPYILRDGKSKHSANLACLNLQPKKSKWLTIFGVITQDLGLSHFLQSKTKKICLEVYLE
jgi:hypothetical protein